MSSRPPKWLTAFTALIYLFLFAPVIVLIVFSFNDSRRAFIWQSFTLDWYPTLFGNDDILDALWVTLQVAAIAVVGSTILGSLLGLGLARLRFRGSGAVQTLLLLPMITPEIITGISLLVFFFQLLGSTGSMVQVSLAHITFCISYVAITVRARAASLDPRLEEAARDLGASAVGAFRYVTLPLIAPAVGAGAMLAFALSFDDLVVTQFNYGVGSTTLPIFIYSSIKFGVTPQINAISTLIVAVVSVALFIAWRLGRSGRSARRWPWRTRSRPRRPHGTAFDSPYPSGTCLRGSRNGRAALRPRASEPSEPTTTSSVPGPASSIGSQT
jgi:spermidine/putrescine transport system permease protein